jgi:CBS domain-containing protein
MVKVADILTHKGSQVITIKPEATLGMLSELLRDKRIGAVVVSNDDRSIDGVISERDVTYALATHKAGLHEVAVSALMTKTVITCSPRDNIGFVASTMMSRNVRHLPVEDEGRLVGMVSIRDVLNFRVDELQRHTAQLRTFVSQMDQPPQDRE